MWIIQFIKNDNEKFILKILNFNFNFDFFSVLVFSGLIVFSLFLAIYLLKTFFLFFYCEVKIVGFFGLAPFLNIFISLAVFGRFLITYY